MSLDNGTTLCRLNQELLPEPGSPMASTTMPLGGRAGAAGTAAGVAWRSRNRSFCLGRFQRAFFGAPPWYPGRSGTMPFARRGEGLRYGLFATASASATATSAAAAASTLGGPLATGWRGCSGHSRSPQSGFCFELRLELRNSGSLEGALILGLAMVESGAGPGACPHQNMPAAGAEPRADFPAPGLSSCGAVSDRASIYACSGL